MSTSIITTTTFTFATMIDYRAFDIGAQASSASTPAASNLESESDEIEITPCMLNALPRCRLTAEKHCTRRGSCKS